MQRQRQCKAAHTENTMQYAKPLRRALRNQICKKCALEGIHNAHSKAHRRTDSQKHTERNGCALEQQHN